MERTETVRLRLKNNADEGRLTNEGCDGGLIVDALMVDEGCD